MIESEIAWRNGKLVPFADCTVHESAFTLHYGVGVFEGIRCYRRENGRSAVFRLPEHVDRLFGSAKICNLEIPYSSAAIAEACKETVRANKFPAAYLRPVVYRGAGALGLGARDDPVETVILCWQWSPLLGEEGIKSGIRAQVSSLTRGHTNNMMTKGKIIGQYVSSVLAKQEALRLGFEEAIMLDAEGRVVEASAENIFLVWQGRLLTPSVELSMLAGITRDAVIALAHDAGIEVIERAFTRDMLYTASEVFLTGTATEVTPVRGIDGRAVADGKPGPVTCKLQDLFYQAVRGSAEPHPEWLAYL